MKCPECNHNQLRGQNGMICRQCSYKFIFDPRKHFCANKKMTDAYFMKCIDKISRNNTYFYTPDELFCFMVQKAKPGIIGSILGSLFITATISYLFNITLNTGLWPILIILPVMMYLNVRYFKNPLKRKSWNKLLTHCQIYAKKYNKQNLLEGLLSYPQLTEKPTPTSESDIFDYGASKLLICQHDIQVDWLVMNQFHTQNGIVIVSESGYPHYLKNQVTHLIETNPELNIFLLHDAGIEGESTASRLRQNQSIWNISQHQCVDLGLTQEQALRTGMNKNIIEQYNNNFPVHALNYHNFKRLLTHSVTNNTTLGAAIVIFAIDNNSDISCNFG